MYVLTVYKQIFSMDFFLISDHGQDLLPCTLQKLQVFAKLNALKKGFKICHTQFSFCATEF